MPSIQFLKTKILERCSYSRVVVVILALFCFGNNISAETNLISKSHLDSLKSIVQDNEERLDFLPLRFRLRMYSDIIQYYRVVDLPKALQYSYQFEEDVEKMIDSPVYPNYRLSVDNVFRDIYNQMQNYPKAQEYALLSYRRAATLDNVTTRYQSLYFLIALFKKAQNYEMVKKYLPELLAVAGDNIKMKLMSLRVRGDYYLSIGQLDSAKLVLQNSIALNDKSLNDSFFASKLYLSLANVYSLQGNKGAAYTCYIKTVSIQSNLTLEDRISAYLELGVLKASVLEFADSDHFFEKAHLLITDNVPLEFSNKYYHLRARAEVAKKDYLLASYYYRSQAEILDSLNKLSYTILSKNFENLNRVFSKEVEIKNLQFENNAKQDRINQARLINYLVLGMLILGMVAALFIFRQINRTNKLQRIALTQENELNEKKLREKVHLLEIEATRSYIEGQEKERDRIGRDLHDSVGGALAGVRMLVDVAANQHKVEVLLDVGNKIQNIYQDVRNLSHDLVKPNLSDGNFKLAIANLGQQFAIQNKTLNVSVYPEINWGLVNQHILEQLYRIVQEALHNIAKHASANVVDVQIVYDSESESLNISIEDDGKGFNPEATSVGIGIANMRTRVQMLRGVFDIDSLEGKGTSISIMLPLEYQDNV